MHILVAVKDELEFLAHLVVAAACRDEVLAAVSSVVSPNTSVTSCG
jgi:hypothetical protein